MDDLLDRIRSARSGDDLAKEVGPMCLAMATMVEDLKAQIAETVKETRSASASMTATWKTEREATLKAMNASVKEMQDLADEMKDAVKYARSAAKIAKDWTEKDRFWGMMKAMMTGLSCGLGTFVGLWIWLK